MTGSRPLLVVDRGAPALGDLLSVAACLPALRALHPDARIVLVCAPEFRALMRATRAADAVLARGTLGYFLLTHLKLRRLRALLPDEAVPPRPRRREPLSAEFAVALGVPAPREPARIHIPPAVQCRVEALLAAEGLRADPFLVVHTGPTWPVKEWTAGAWDELARLVRERIGLAVVQVGTDCTSEQKPRRAPRWPGAVDWVNHLTLFETAAVIARGAAFIGIDSGPLHLASAVRRPALGLFGATDARTCLFSHPASRGLHTDIPCIGCHQNAEGPGHTREDCPHAIACMKRLAPEDVFHALIEMLQGVRGEAVRVGARGA